MKCEPSLESIILRWFFLIALISALGVACIGAIIAILRGGFWSDQAVQLVVYMPIIILVGSSIGLSGTLILQSGRLVNYMRAMIFLLLIACLLWIIILWNPDIARSSIADSYYRIASSLSIVVLSLLLISQLLILKTNSVILRIIAMLLIASMGASIAALLLSIWINIDELQAELVYATLTIWIIFNVIAIVIIPPIARSFETSKPQQSETIETKATLNLSCPKCDKWQSLATGLVRCISCKFTMIIELQEPRCDCGYLLFKLQGDVCPECGRKVPEPDRRDPLPADGDINKADSYEVS